MAIAETFASTRVTTVGDFFALLKPRVMSLVVFTGLAGIVVAPGHINPLTGSPRFCASPLRRALRAR